MMGRSCRVVLGAILLIAVFGITPCKAQTPPPNPASSSTPTQTQNQNGQRLTLQDAENIAIQNHPQIQAAAQLALAATAQMKEVQSAYYPQASGAVTGAKAETNSRIEAGFLNSPSLFDKFAEGVSVSQLVTDFGRTHEFSKSSHFHAQAQQENVVTTRADVLLRVNEAYFAVLKAQAVLQVADETVKARQLVAGIESASLRDRIRRDISPSRERQGLVCG